MTNASEICPPSNHTHTGFGATGVEEQEEDVAELLLDLYALSLAVRELFSYVFLRRKLALLGAFVNSLHTSHQCFFGQITFGWIMVRF